MVQQLSTNTFTTAKWIVSPTLSNATHTTISAAIASASSGDTIFIRDGSYTEDLTLKVGVNLVAYLPNGLTPNVTIVGNCTLTTAGTVSISGIRLQTNGANPFLTVSGSAASIINLDYCYLNASTNNGIVYSSSSASSRINISNCQGQVLTAATKIYDHTSSGTLTFTNCSIAGTASNAANNNSAGGVVLDQCVIFSQFSTSGTGVLFANHSNFNSGNNVCFLITGTGNASQLNFCNISSGTGASCSVSAAATLNVVHIIAGSSVGGGNALTGAGNLNYAFIAFTGTATSQNVTVATAYTVL